MHSALTIEEVLVKHPKLRVYIMHAGYPMIDDLLPSSTLTRRSMSTLESSSTTSRARVLSLPAGDGGRRIH
jgi:predicted TIM-barrel fold metal-dependent hydrolase